MALCNLGFLRVFFFFLEWGGIWAWFLLLLLLFCVFCKVRNFNLCCKWNISKCFKLGWQTDPCTCCCTSSFIGRCPICLCIISSIFLLQLLDLHSSLNVFLSSLKTCDLESNFLTSYSLPRVCIQKMVLVSLMFTLCLAVAGQCLLCLDVALSMAQVQNVIWTLKWKF